MTGFERPRLRVGAFPSAAASIMPPALAELRATHPEADVAMRVMEDARRSRPCAGESSTSRWCSTPS